MVLDMCLILSDSKTCRLRIPENIRRQAFESVTYKMYYVVYLKKLFLVISSFE